MADITETLKSILGDDAEDKIKSVMGSLSAEDNPAPNNLGQLMQLKGLVEGLTMDRNDPRTNLLMSLKPYMRENRQGSIDKAVKLMGIMNMAKLFKL